MARIVSVSVPDDLHKRWQESDLDISPSSLFQHALEGQLNRTNQMLNYWATRALTAEKKLKTIQKLIEANESQFKTMLILNDVAMTTNTEE